MAVIVVLPRLKVKRVRGLIRVVFPTLIPVLL